MSISFDGRVAIVTGAGRGMGREVALSLARRGARIVVNDYGGGESTLDKGTIDVAQAVVEEIAAFGGTAVADGASVGTGETATAIVEHAIAAFGRVDILVNNAGGNIGGPIDALTDAQVEGVLRSNFIGGYMLLRRVWPHMMAAGHGRIVNVASSGMFGMARMSAYAPAKAAMYGLTTVAAVEGRPHDIHVNVALPVGTTRLVGRLPQGPLADWMQNFPPNLVAEPIAFLCSRECTATGEMFSIGGGRVARTAIANADGFFDPSITAESLAANFAQALDMTGAAIVTSTRDDNERFFPVVPWPTHGAGAVATEREGRKA